MNRKFPFWILGVVVGAAFLGIGIGNGQIEEIYRKAIMICLECIGIG